MTEAPRVRSLRQSALLVSNGGNPGGLAQEGQRIFIEDGRLIDRKESGSGHSQWSTSIYGDDDVALKRLLAGKYQRELDSFKLEGVTPENWKSYLPKGSQASVDQ